MPALIDTAPRPEARKEVIHYRPSATAYRFHCSTAFVRGIMGPFGSGKSVACCIEIGAKASQQRPFNGVRSTRWAIVRNTYPELKSTTIKTWCEWYPPPLCDMVYSAPIVGYLRLPGPDGIPIEAEVLFLSLDRPRDVKKLLGLELTGAWVDEAREIEWTMIDKLTGRVGRYPGKRRGGPSWRGIIMCTNPPHTRHWWYTKAEVEVPPNWEFFRQPPALLPAGNWYTPNTAEQHHPLGPAENVENQPLGWEYWYQQLAGKTAEEIKVYIFGEYGNVFSGQPVYEGVYSDSLHLAKLPLPIFRGLPVILGWDFGTTPACIFMQVTPNGRLYVQREAACIRGGVRQFTTDVVLPLLVRDYPGMAVQSWGDPSGISASQVDITENPIRELGLLGIPTQPAKTNQFDSRREAVLYWLTRMIDGRPAFQLDPSCQGLREGFLGGYQFARVQVHSEFEKYRDIPEKNEYSHPHDALQYGALHAKGETITPSGAAARRAVPSRSSWKGRV